MELNQESAENSSSSSQNCLSEAYAMAQKKAETLQSFCGGEEPILVFQMAVESVDHSKADSTGCIVEVALEVYAQSKAKATYDCWLYSATNARLDEIPGDTLSMKATQCADGIFRQIIAAGIPAERSSQ